MKTFSIFVDPSKVDSVVHELEYEGLDVTHLGAGGPVAIVYFKGEQPTLNSFLENNSFEIEADHVTEEG
jgi:hypothetical protein